MKIGGFGRIIDYDNIYHAGFDYAELDVPEIEALSENEFHMFCAKVHEAGLPVSIGARALPIMDAWFFTDRYCGMDYEKYLENACERARLLGMDKIIFGNGKARQLIDEFSVNKEHRFIHFMKMFAEIADEKDIEVILEPLGPQYTNYINTLPEAVEIINKVGMSNLFTMVDLRHLVWAKESLTDIEAYINYIHHIHIDYPTSYPERPYPKMEDDFNYRGFLEVVKKTGYKGTLTIEADIPDDWKSAYKGVMAVLKEYL